MSRLWMIGDGMVDWLRLGRVLVVLGVVLVLSCSLGPRAGRRACASDDVDVFLEGFERAVVNHDTGLLLAEYIDPTYRREQLEDLLGGDQRQFFDELFGLGKNRFDDIAEMEFLCDEIRFEALEYGPDPNAQLAQIPVRITYENGTRIEDGVFVIKYSSGDRTFAIEGPRG